MIDQIKLKRLYLIGIKYGPSIMALTCCFKLFFDSIDNTPTNIYEDVVHILNLILALFVIGMFYITGLYFHYCWRHQSLCRIAVWGYIFYFFFLFTKPPQNITIILTSWYMIFTLSVTLTYKRV